MTISQLSPSTTVENPCYWIVHHGDFPVPAGMYSYKATQVLKSEYEDVIFFLEQSVTLQTKRL